MASQIIRYRANDNMVFDTMEEAEAHEAEQVIITVLLSNELPLYESACIRITKVLRQHFNITPKEQNDAPAQQ